MELLSFEDFLAPQLEAKMTEIRLQHEVQYRPLDGDILEIVKRSEFPTMHVKQGKKKRVCQNMKGILGGSNAFNFMSFVAGVITLVVNVNNNVNNNNNNLNGINANTNSQQNNNANANNNAANIIIAMPGKKRKKRSDVSETFLGPDSNCIRMGNTEMLNFPFAVLQALQLYENTMKEKGCNDDKYLCGLTDTLINFFHDELNDEDFTYAST